MPYIAHFQNSLRRFSEWWSFFFHTAVAWAYVLFFSIPLCYFVWFRIFLLAYAIFRYLHRDCEHYGGLRSDCSHAAFYKNLGNYLNIRFIPMTEIPLGRNYLLAVYPHGATAHSHFSACANKDLPGAEVFAGRRVHFAVSSNVLKTAFSREHHLAADCIDASEYSIVNALQCIGRGKFVYLLPGGAREASLNSDTIILKKRKGFCRVALKTGAYLIPTYVFGEIELFDNADIKEGSFLLRLQRFLLDYDGIVLRMLKGQGWFNLWLSLPPRGPVSIVMGEPIPVDKVEFPTAEQINQLHEIYTSRLCELYDRYKFSYFKNPFGRCLNII